VVSRPIGCNSKSKQQNKSILFITLPPEVVQSQSEGHPAKENFIGHSTLLWVEVLRKSMSTVAILLAF
jgi:hypothetical protein